MRFLLLASIVAALSGFFTTQHAAAHAKLVRAIPEPGSVLGAVPAAVRLWFSEELEPSLSSLTVWGPRGVSAVAGMGGVDLNDLSRRSMVAALRPLRAGTYTVRWRAASADDLAVTQGSYQFIVRP